MVLALLLAGWAAAAPSAPIIPCSVPGRADAHCSWTKERGWAYLDRSGKVIVGGVAAFDNGPAAFHDGLVRVERGGKCGFADASGRLVIKPLWSGCLDFDGGVARVCKGCAQSCDGGDCEHKSLKGGVWTCLDTRGRKKACPPPR